MTLVKICGLKTQETVDAAVQAGANFLGFVFYPSSPRAISPKEAAGLIGSLPEHVKTVGLFVDPTDSNIKKTLEETPLDMVQLHGEEPPERLRELRNRFSLPIIKAFPVASKDDLKPIANYTPHCDWLLFDTKTDGDLPGGTGQSFDWSILKDMQFDRPWMLSGGLNEDNVKQALSTLSPRAVDVSSGVESERGVKDTGKIKSFIATVKKQHLIIRI